MFQLEQHCRNLEGELDHVKDEILKMISDKSSKSRENETLRKYVKAYEEARAENDGLRKEMALLKLAAPPKSPSLSSNSSSSSSSSTHNIDRSSPDGQEFETTSSSTASSPASGSPACLRKTGDDGGDSSVGLSSEKGSDVEAARQEVEGLRAKLGAEQKASREKISELEESLELMRGEFENMEDYWQVSKERTFIKESCSIIWE